MLHICPAFFPPNTIKCKKKTKKTFNAIDTMQQEAVIQIAILKMIHLIP